MEAKLHIELQSIECELKDLQKEMDNANIVREDFEDMYEQWLSVRLDGIRVAKELQYLMAKRDNCDSQKHLMLKKYPSKYKSLKDLDYLNEYYL